MNRIELPIFTYILQFREGTYCSQVKAENIESSIFKWFEKIKEEKNEIKFLGNKTLNDIEFKINNQTNIPTKLDRLNNVWFLHFSSKTGSFFINIIKTSNS
ncbi:hypothetical protein [Flavobacterium quisquiliarum]|uniref:Uncharacterized protein n=1 Tax=Flavobacterium quisquiliarum TaxID=1834436 RepID=A0ABV8W8Q9_9FLAO|nr:hypothetical protein [Flavobacterium quisquiliarum]MBW1656547.1 hypothetical protein [Flavobacterium quisquiliarum]NWL03784.1 hypothetical protein [Flavobacterium collinsii]